MQLLKEGNGIENVKKNPIKYAWGHIFDYNLDTEIPLAQDVLNLFDQIMIAIIARVSKADQGELINVNKGGSTKIPELE